MSSRWRRVAKGGPGRSRASAGQLPTIYLRSDSTKQVYAVQLSKALGIGTPAKVFSHSRVPGIVTLPATLAVADMEGGVWGADTVSSSGNYLYDCRLGPFRGYGDSRVDTEDWVLPAGNYPAWLTRYADNPLDFEATYEVATEQVYSLDIGDYVAYGTDFFRIVQQDLSYAIAQNPKFRRNSGVPKYGWDVMLSDGSWSHYFEWSDTLCDALPSKYLYTSGFSSYINQDAIYDPAVWQNFQQVIGIHGDAVRRWGYGTGSYHPYEAGLSGFGRYGYPSWYILWIPRDGVNYITWLTPSEDFPSNPVSGSWPYYIKTYVNAEDIGIKIDGLKSNGYVYRVPSWAAYMG